MGGKLVVTEDLQGVISHRSQGGCFSLVQANLKRYLAATTQLQCLPCVIHVCD